MVMNNKLDIIVNSNRIGALKDDIVNYSIDVTNIANIDVTNLLIQCILPGKLEFFGSLKLNGTSITGNSSSITIGTLAINTTSTISFDAKIISVTGGQAIVKALGDYNYIDDTNNTVNGTDESNQNILTIYKPDLLITQSSNKEMAKIGDSIIFLITIFNSGDIDINNLVLKDDLPTQLNLQTIKIDDVVNVGNIITGLSIGTLNRGATKKIALYIDILGLLNGTDTFTNSILANFDVTADLNFPSVSISKTVLDINNIVIVRDFATLKKKIILSYESIGNNVEYTLLVTNELKAIYENSTLYDVIVSDTLAPELKFIGGSLKIDNVNFFDANIIHGVNLGDLHARESKTITFLAKILSQNLSPITNFATLEYKFIMSYYLPMQFDVIYSNNVGIISKITDISLIKSADKTQASVNDEIIYTVSIDNTSDVDIIKAVFKDILPSYVNLIDGSFKINNIVVNTVEIENGVVVGSINAGDTMIINYTVIVSSLDSSGKIENTAIVDYIYKFPDDITESKSKTSNKVTINLI